MILAFSNIFSTISLLFAQNQITYQITRLCRSHSDGSTGHDITPMMAVAADSIYRHSVANAYPATPIQGEILRYSCIRLVAPQKAIEVCPDGKERLSVPSGRIL